MAKRLQIAEQPRRRSEATKYPAELSETGTGRDALSSTATTICKGAKSALGKPLPG